MKTLLLLSGFLFISMSSLSGQVIDPKQTAKRSAENRTNSKIDEGINKGFDKIEEGIGNIFKKKEKKKTGKKEESTDNQENNQNGKTTSSEKKSDNTTESNSSSKSIMKIYSKFDFVSGEKVLAFDDFSTTNVGDFPLGWNTNSTAEIVTVEGNPNKWLLMSKDGFFQPEYVKDMPENFTLEFDLQTRYNSNNLLNYSLYLSSVEGNVKKDLANKYITNGVYFNWRPGIKSGGYIVYENNEEIGKNEELNIEQFEATEIAEPVSTKISIWRQKSRLRIYVNQTKVLDIPQAFDAKLKYNVFKFGASYVNYVTERDHDDEFMVSNVRYAVGAPDTRNKLITEGKLVTRGILFDINSDKIKPESYGILKEIGTVLKENPAVKVKIIGHTDSDGEDTQNLDLSKRRAASVKNALNIEFGIESNRLETDGKGETQPSDPNTTPQGKANNRRVEFIKL
ncbi:OmpA family protein [Arcicella sp. DC2W]|uniref:OmpA family protein n=1 Tax=Arcicella gelida TaxID=2984195 RepID=A0ABU5RYQ1_9BACT|nr:OmpA family protein [Arcicella sp. DC2W]MEA5401353.1 OmpA family protein [Arcicella sp. DC2W]